MHHTVNLQLIKFASRFTPKCSINKI